MSAFLLTNFPTLNQNTTGTAAGLASSYIDWNAVSGGAFILNKPTLGALAAAAYPGAGIPNSTGSSWGTSYTVGTAANNIVQLNGSSQLPAVSAFLLTNFPTLNQSTTGNAATATAFATTPTKCSAGNYPLGIDISGNAQNCTAASGAGTVTSFSVTSVPSWLTPSVATATTTPALTLSLTSGQTANQFLATPNGSAGALGLRSILAADIPTLNQSTSGNAATATAFASTPTKCSAGNYPLGIDVSGNAQNCTAAAGSGTVSSVALTTPAWLTVGGSPVTTSGTLAVTATTGQTANQFLASPNGSTGAVALRAIVSADIPTLNQNTTGTATSLTSYNSTAACAKDGTTDDTACVQAVFTAAVSGGNGGHVHVIKGTYKITDMVTVPANAGLVVECDSPSSTTFLWAGTATAKPMFLLGNQRDFHWRGCGFKYNSSFTGEEPILLANMNPNAVDPGHGTFEDLIIECTNGYCQGGIVSPPMSRGTANVTNGSPNVVWATGTTFSTATSTASWQYWPGKIIRLGPSQTQYTISSVTDSTHLVLTANYAGTTASGVYYDTIPFDANGDFVDVTRAKISNYSGTAVALGVSQNHNWRLINNQFYGYVGKCGVAGQADGTVGSHSSYEVDGGFWGSHSVADLCIHDSPGLGIKVTHLSSELSRRMVKTTTAGGSGAAFPLDISDYRFSVSGNVNTSTCALTTDGNIFDFEYPGPISINETHVEGCLDGGGTYPASFNFKWLYTMASGTRPSFEIRNSYVEGGNTTLASLFPNSMLSNAQNFTVHNNNNSSSGYTMMDIQRETTNVHACTVSCGIALSDSVVTMSASGAVSVNLPRMDFYQTEMDAAIGKKILIKDIGGNAATNNITVQKDPSDANSTTIDGATSKVINLNYGFIELRYVGAGKYSIVASSYSTGGSGTVTSVALTAPTWLSVAGTPVTSSGTLAVTAATGQTAHQVIGTCGSATSFGPCSPTQADIASGTIATGSTISMPVYVEYTAAVCQNATASLGFSTPTSNAATAVCITGTNTQIGAAQFTATAQSVQGRFILPDDWVSGTNNDLVFRWRNSATSGNVVWSLQTSCVANTGVVVDPSWNTAQTVSTASQGTTLWTNTATLSTFTSTGCSAGNVMFFKVALDATSTVTLGTVDLLSARFKLKRTITTY